MSFDANQSVWQKTGATTDVTGTQLIEDGSTGNRHSFWQDIQPLIDSGHFGSSGIVEIRVTPVGRTKCWIGIRQNNVFYLQTFDLVAGGSTPAPPAGSNVSSSLIQSNGDGSYNCRVVYAGTFSTTSTVVAIGAMIDDNQQSYDGVNALHALTVHDVQLIKGTNPVPYAPTTDRSIYPDLVTSDGAQDFDVSGTTPNTLNVDNVEWSGQPAAITSDFTYDLDGFSVVDLCDWGGNMSAEKVLSSHWGSAGQRSWKMSLTSDGKLEVRLSGDGTATAKHYRAVNPLDIGQKTMCSFTWSGSELRLYINDVELTTANGELSKIVDDALSGAVHNSTASVKGFDLHYGKGYKHRQYNGVLTASEVDTVAAMYGVSGLPNGSGTPGPSPTTGDFLAVNNVVVVEAESFDISGTSFVLDTTEAGYTGTSYIRYNAADDFTLPPTDVISIPFFVPVAGTWQIALRHNHDPAAANDEENDCWLDVPTANDSNGFEKWGHNATDYGNGFTFATFREPTPGNFEDKWFDLNAGSHTLEIGGRSQNWRFDRVHIYLVGTSGAENAALAESPRAGSGGGGNVPNTTAEMVTYLNGKGVSSIFYVNNATGNDSNAGTEASPWATIQKAANTLVAGQAVIIQGEGGRFYEQVTPPNSGSSGSLIWFVGDPEHPAILDASESFNVTWTDRGGGMWSAPYNRTRYFSDETAYFAQSPGQGLVPLQTFAAHQVIHDDQQLIRASSDTPTANPSSLNQGECYFKTAGTSDANFRTPTEVWVRLTGDANPNTETMRIASDKKYLFDYSPNTWEEGFPGTESDSVNYVAQGRDYLGLVNMHFKFGAVIRKKSPLAIRGRGWFLEWCSVSDSNAYSFTVAGEEHTIINCKFIRSGQGPCRLQWAQNGSGTTLIEKCLFEDDNIHFYPPSWDAGFKISHAGDGGTTIIRDCHFNRSNAVGLWWDIFNGKQNGTGEAFLVERCIFEEQGRHGVFVEHNSENVIIRNCGLWKTTSNTEGNYNQTLGTGFRIAGAGLCTFSNNVIALSDGIGFYSKAGQDGRGPNNRDTITNNVILSNNIDPNHDIARVEYFGGDDVDEPGTYPWSSSQIDGNVFYNALPTGVNYFAEANDNSNWVFNDSISWFQDASRTNGQNNVIAANVGVVVEDINDRKKFWNTNFAGGSYPTKGPQGLVHYEDLSDTGWTIPT